jgi:hypothetical protein
MDEPARPLEGPPHYPVIQRHLPEEAIVLTEKALHTRVRAVRKDTIGASHAIYFLTCLKPCPSAVA